LRPRQIWADGAINVTVQNGGNARQAFVITPADRVDEVVFDPPQAQIALAEGETATAEFVAAPRRPRAARALSPFRFRWPPPVGRPRLTTERCSPTVSFLFGFCQSSCWSACARPAWLPMDLLTFCSA
jgi:hypothetical protein